MHLVTKAGFHRTTIFSLDVPRGERCFLSHSQVWRTEIVFVSRKVERAGVTREERFLVLARARRKRGKRREGRKQRINAVAAPAELKCIRVSPGLRRAVHAGSQLEAQLRLSNFIAHERSKHLPGILALRVCPSPPPAWFCFFLVYISFYHFYSRTSAKVVFLQGLENRCAKYFQRRRDEGSVDATRNKTLQVVHYTIRGMRWTNLWNEKCFIDYRWNTMLE